MFNPVGFSFLSSYVHTHLIAVGVVIAQRAIDLRDGEMRVFSRNSLRAQAAAARRGLGEVPELRSLSRLAEAEGLAGCAGRSRKGEAKARAPPEGLIARGTAFQAHTSRMNR